MKNQQGKFLLIIINMLMLMMIGTNAFAQLSPNTVKYQLTYDISTGRYTVWVVPDYSTPNSAPNEYNLETNEKGATAQVTIKVPKDFEILAGSMLDIKGDWPDSPPKLNGGIFGLDANFSYYILGKAPGLTDYGPFAQNTPVALFSFLGNSCYGQVGILAKGDPFVTAAAASPFFLNVECSFYSKSGQPGNDIDPQNGGNQVPLEQFIDKLGPDTECRLPIATRDDASGTYAAPVVIPNVLVNDSTKIKQPAVNGVNVVLNTTFVDGPNPAKGSAVLLPSGQLTYTSVPGFTGTDTLIYQICDIDYPANCDTALVVITILPGIDADNDTLGIVASNSSIVGYPILGNDTLNGLTPLASQVAITVLDPALKGTVTINAGTGGLTYTPNPGFSGADSLRYRICDALNPTVCDSAWVFVTITPVIDAVNDIAGNVPSGGSLTYPLITNDTLNGVGNFNPTLVNITTLDPADKGTASINPTTGVVTYTPTPGFSGPDSLLYKICDKLNPTVCDSAWVFFNITPVIVASYDNLGIVASGSTLVKPLFVNDTLNKVGNFDPTLVNITMTAAPNKGTASINPTTGQVTYTPNPGVSGFDSMIYRICDKLNPTVCDTALVVVRIAPVIVASYDNLGTVPSGGSITKPLLVNDTLNSVGSFNPNLVIMAVTDTPSKGTALINAATGQVTYTPDAGVSGMDTLIYQICDKLNPSVCDTALVVVNIAPVIVASYDNLGTVASGGTITKPLFVNDILNNIGNFNPNLVNITMTDAPNKGTASINPTTGQVTYTPNAGASGVDSLIYQICDKLNPTVCDTALVVVRITPVIAAVDDTVPPVLAGGTVTYPLITNDTLNGVGNFDPTLVTISVIDPADKGTATINPTTGQVTYTPTPGFSGPDSLLYKICDKLNPTVCDSAWVFFTITPVIVASYDNLGTVVADSSITYSILLNDSLNRVSPIDTSVVTVTLVQNGNRGVGTLNPNGTLTYLAGSGQSGLDSLVYRICDKLNPTVCDTALVVVRIEAPLLLLPKVYLQGSLFGVTYTDSPTNTLVDSLMRDDLRVQNLIPLTSPYGYWNPTIAANTDPSGGTDGHGSECDRGLGVCGVARCG